jgi:acyl dehydratase
VDFTDNRTFDEIVVGESASLKRRLTAGDMGRLRAMSGEANMPTLYQPSPTRGHGDAVVSHGLWSCALISSLVGTQLPGPGSLCIEQTLRFLLPVSLGDVVNASVSVREKQALDQKVVLECQCANQPGVILHLLDEKGMSVEAITDMLYHRCGLLGMSGVSNDMRVLLADGGGAAIDVFVYRVSREIGAMMTALEGMDALVFTGGIGEHAAQIRARVCEAFQWMGLRLEVGANAQVDGCARITALDSAISAYVIPTDEHLVVARHTRSLLASQF